MEEALEQYLILAKTAKGKACQSLILQALSNSHTFVFGQLIQATSNAGVSQQHSNLLRLFAYGTYNDYKASPSDFPVLSDQHIKKLKMLSLATLAAKNSMISYHHLQTALEIQSVRELEDMIIQSIYQGLISAKIDHKQHALKVMSSYGRDVPPEQFQMVIGKLSRFLSHLERVQEFIGQQIDHTLSARTVAQLRDQEFNQKHLAAKAQIRQEMEKKSNYGMGQRLTQFKGMHQ